MIHDETKKVNAVLMAGWTGAAASIDLVSRIKAELLSAYTESFLSDGIACLQHQQAGGAMLKRALSGYLPEVFCMELGGAGVFCGLWELGSCLDTGLEIDLMKIPIRQLTIELGEFLDLNPYYFDSSGSSLLVCADGDGLCRYLNQEKIPAVVIGRTTKGKARRLRNGEDIRFLTPN